MQVLESAGFLAWTQCNEFGALVWPSFTKLYPSWVFIDGYDASTNALVPPPARVY